ncbi:GAF and ANTAR domain-containing protein [Cryptosporangium minutisporangium]|uniref:GAF and ANTAR domain-containing protein n=1 Tax=Cryptosporangium minutisporangium TaxID=113569 RepID=UPI0031E55B44
MTADRRAKVLAALAEQDPGLPMQERICATAVLALPVTGAGLSLIGGARGHRILVHGTDPVAQRLEDLQLTLGVGPCVESVRRGGPVLVPDLERQPDARWPGFIRPALEAGVRAMFAFPLQVGAVCLGALDLHRDRVGGLVDDHLADALVFTDLVTATLLDAPLDGVNAGHGPSDWLSRADSVVYQASGMVKVQLGVSIDDALLRMRAHAFLRDQTISAVAQEVVNRRLRFDPDP